MKRLCILLALLVLAACVPEPQEKARPAPTPGEEAAATPQPLGERVIPYPYFKVFREQEGLQQLWGYDKEGRLIIINDSARTVVLTYDAEGRITSIDDGVKPMTFFHDNNGRLLRAEQGPLHWLFTYTSKGALLSVQGKETLRVAHDSKGRLSSVTRGGGASTEFTYDALNRTKEMFRGAIATQLSYDDRNRLTLLSREDDHLVLAYWRENLLSSISGTMYGLKETVNYGPGEITLVSNVEETVFRSEYAQDTQPRFDAFNTFLFCTRFRKLPVTFDGQSWVLYHEYLKGNITEYLNAGFVCDFIR
jgi:YD repeat-containing protein